MDPVTMMVVGNVINLGAGALAEWIGSGKDAEERRLRREAAELYASMSPPEVQDLVAREVSGTAMSGVRADEGLQAVQDEAQGRLLDRGRNGPSMSYRAAREEQGMEAARRAQGDRASILAEGRARGTVGSGEELLAQLDAGQAAAETERMAGVRSLANDEELSLQAMLQAAGLAGEREQRDLSTQMAIATAEDDIAMFNSGLDWQQQTFNAQQRQRHFENQLGLADRKASIKLGDADRARRDAQRQREMIGGLGQSAGYGFAVAAGQPTARPAVQPQQQTYAPAAPAPMQHQAQPTQHQVPTRRRAS